MSDDSNAFVFGSHGVSHENHQLRPQVRAITPASSHPIILSPTNTPSQFRRIPSTYSVNTPSQLNKHYQPIRQHIPLILPLLFPSS